MTRTQLLVLALAFLAAVSVGWVVRSGLWKRHRIGIVGVALVVGLLALTRRIGLQELAIVGGAVLLFALFLPARR